MSHSFSEADSQTSVCPHCHQTVHAHICYMVLEGVQYEERVTCPECGKLIWSSTSDDAAIIVVFFVLAAILFALYKIFLS